MSNDTIKRHRFEGYAPKTWNCAVLGCGLSAGNPIHAPEQPAREDDVPEHFGAMEPSEADDPCSHSDKEWQLSTVNLADVKCDYDYIASATTRKHAKQIVTDHARAALVPKLVEALEDLLQYPHEQVIADRARAALAAARKAGVE